MSSDNWTVCPWCARDADAARASAIQEAESQYGKLSPEDFTKAVDDAREMPRSDSMFPTWREDWSVGFRSEKSGGSTQIRMVYEGSCTECERSIRRDYSEPLKLEDA